jgi:hypothetical protein
MVLGEHIMRGFWLLILLPGLWTVCPQASRGEMNNANKNIATIQNEDIVIAPNAVKVPIEYILLVRRNEEYCAIKFTKFWIGKTQEDEYAKYEAFYQFDKTGNFTNKNIKIEKGELSRPRLRGIGRFSFSFGNTDIRCGTFKLFWSGKGWVYFFNSNQKQGDYGIELAPTKWTDISQVNVFDPRLKWFRHDENRKRVNIPVDQLWEDN